MGVVQFSHRGSFKNTERFLTNRRMEKILRVLNQMGQEGLTALRGATPVDTGVTAGSWGYKASVSKDGAFLEWYNTSSTSEGKYAYGFDGIPIVILLQYGHGVKGGGYVAGRDFINPAIKPVFDKISNAVWKEVSM